MSIDYKQDRSPNYVDHEFLSLRDLAETKQVFFINFIDLKTQKDGQIKWYMSVQLDDTLPLSWDWITFFAYFKSGKENWKVKRMMNDLKNELLLNGKGLAAHIEKLEENGYTNYIVVRDRVHDNTYNDQLYDARLADNRL